MCKVIFFGAGGYAHYLWRQIMESPFFHDQYVAFSDNNRGLWGGTFKSLKIIPPSELKQDIADFFVITSIYDKEIRKQLKYEIGIPEDKIYSFDEYKRKCYTQWQYNKRYGDLAISKAKPAERSSFNLKKVVIYTAITGGYDELHDPLYIDNNLTYICFTNNRNIKSDFWNVEYIYDNQLDHMHLAKRIKLFPHLYLKEFETSIWVDGKLGIQQDLRSYIRKYEKNKPILCFPHYERDCIYEEAGVCLYYKKGNKEDIVRQISNYYQKGYPINNGLYEMACIVRKHNDELVQKVMDNWQEEIERYSYRDQLSFPVACYNSGFLPDICDLDIYNNKWLRVYAHSL